MSLSASDLKRLSESSFVPVIRSSVKQLFSAADSSVLKLAQDAEENTEQNRHFESVQALRIASHEINTSFLRCLVSAFYVEARASHDETDSEHVNSLRKLISIDMDAWSADKSFSAALADLKQRLAVIDKTIENPFEPHRFVECFLHSLGGADIDIYSKMLVLRLFEGQLYTRLGQFVCSVNEVLAKEGVLPKLDTSAAEPQTNADAAVLAFAGEKQGLLANAGSDRLLLALSDLQANDYEVMEDTLSVERIGSSMDDLQVRDLVAELRSQKLISPEQLKEAGLQVEKIELVGRLFQLVIADRNLPKEARILIACLQLPYTRIALSDPLFLPETKHPAKVLLNEITRLCADWLPDKEALAGDVLFRKLKSTVQVFLESERVENINYRELLFEFLALRESQRQKDLETAQRLLESQYGASAADVIREEIKKVLEGKMSGLDLPAAGVRVVNEGWNNVLYICALQKGIGSEEWEKTLSIVDDLLSTFKPPGSFASRSEFLLKLPGLLKALRVGLTTIALAPGLIEEFFRDLEEAHKKIVVKITGDFEDLVKVATFQPKDDGFSLEFDSIKEVISKNAVAVVKKEANSKLKAEKSSSKVKTAENQLVEQPVASEKPVRQPEEMPEKITKTVPEKKAERQVVAVEPSAAILDDGKKELDPLKRLGQGSSLLWNKAQGQVRCKIAAHIKPMKKYIVTDRSGAKIAEITEEQMAQKIASKEIESVDSDTIFDRALESVIGDIRGKR